MAEGPFVPAVGGGGSGWSSHGVEGLVAEDGMSVVVMFGALLLAFGGRGQSGVQRPEGVRLFWGVRGSVRSILPGLCPLVVRVLCLPGPVKVGMDVSASLMNGGVNCREPAP